MVASFFTVFSLVFIAEIGDKTMLLAMLLAAKYQKPKTILLAIAISTLLNHYLAAAAGQVIAQIVDPHILKWSLSLCFLGFGLWVLVPDKAPEQTPRTQWGAFITTLIVFFIAEMGDKTQLATVALAAKIKAPLLVTLASTLGLMATNIPSVYLGHQLVKGVRFELFRKIAAISFFIMALLVGLGWI